MAWLEDYSGRKEFYVSIVYDSVPDYQVKILVGESSTATGTTINCEMLTSALFDDIRFTTEDGQTLLPYWIETITGNSPNRIATVWLKCDANLLQTKFYLYYGNPVVSSASDGNSTFAFFEDFDGTSVDTDEWGLWAGSGDAVVSGSIFSITGIDTSTYNAWGSKQQFGTNYAFRSYSKTNSETTASDLCAIGLDDRSANGTYSGTGPDQAVVNSSTSIKQYANTVNGSSYATTSRSDVMTSWTVVEIQRNAATNIKFYWNNTLKATHTNYLPVDNMGFIFYTNHSGATVYVDWCLVRKYRNIEPTISNVGTHETSTSWLNGWTYRRRLKITAPTATVSGLPLKYLVGEIPGLSGASMDCAGEGLSSFDDLRFTEDDGQTLIPHYIETISGTTPNQIATTWIRPSYVNTDPTQYFMYFGNSGASSTSSSGTTFSGTSIGMADYTQKVITRYGHTTLSTSQYKFDNSSSYFDGTDDYLTIPDSSDWDFGTDLFTIDWWFNATNPSTWRGLLGQYDAGGRGTYELYIGDENNSNKVLINLYYNSWADYWLSGNYTINVWNHAAIVRESTTSIKLYINGILVDTEVIPSDLPINNTSNIPLYVGKTYRNSTSNCYQGYLDEFRISKGIARWTENFTPPTSPHIADEYDVLLLHFNNIWSPTSFYDESGFSAAKPVLSSVGVVTNEVDRYTKLLIHGHQYFGIVDSATEKTITKVGNVDNVTGKPITIVGNTVIKTGQYKFNNSSCYFDGTGDYLTVPDSIDWYFGTSPFTIDCWIRLTALPTTSNAKGIINQYPGSTPYWLLTIYNSSGDYQLTFAVSDTNICVYSFVPELNTWYHVAIVRESISLTKMYLGGYLVDSDTTQYVIPDINATINVGSHAGSWGCFQGYIDEMRVSMGIARWTSEFTPPTSAYLPDSNTMLLLHFDGTDNSTTIIDNSIWHSGFNLPINFDGTTDGLTLLSSNDWFFGTEPFTIDFWYKINACPASGYNQYIMMQYTTTNNIFYLYFGNTSGYDSINRPVFGLSFGDYSYLAATHSSDTILNGWHHYAVVRENIYTTKAYIDGILFGISTFEYAITKQTSTLYVGSHYSGTGSCLNGQLDEFRISKGIARWTENFTPPTSPYLVPEPEVELLSESPIIYIV